MPRPSHALTSLLTTLLAVAACSSGSDGETPSLTQENAPQFITKREARVACELAMRCCSPDEFANYDSQQECLLQMPSSLNAAYLEEATEAGRIAIDLDAVYSCFGFLENLTCMDYNGGRGNKRLLDFSLCPRPFIIPKQAPGEPCKVSWECEEANARCTSDDDGLQVCSPPDLVGPDEDCQRDEQCGGKQQCVYNRDLQRRRCSLPAEAGTPCRDDSDCAGRCSDDPVGQERTCVAVCGGR